MILESRCMFLLELDSISFIEWLSPLFEVDWPLFRVNWAIKLTWFWQVAQSGLVLYSHILKTSWIKWFLKHSYSCPICNLHIKCMEFAPVTGCASLTRAPQMRVGPQKNETTSPFLWSSVREAVSLLFLYQLPKN